jgi:Papain fold toxin 1, glutamine deamidase
VVMGSPSPARSSMGLPSPGYSPQFAGMDVDGEPVPMWAVPSDPYGGPFFGGRYAGAGAGLFAVPVRSDVSVGEVAAVYPWLPGVNPFRGVGGEFGTNCVITAIATDMSLREGVGHQASAASALPERDLVNYQAQQLGLGVGDDARVFRVGGLDEIRAVVGAAGVGARGVVVVRGADSEVSHAFNVVHDERGVSFLDGQQGGLARAPETVTDLVFLPLSEGIEEPRPLPVPPALLAEADAIAGAYGVSLPASASSAAELRAAVLRDLAAGLPRDQTLARAAGTAASLGLTPRRIAP